MCGINGIFAYRDAAVPVDPAELVRTRDHMAARGPDAAGAWLDGDARVGFGHRRLSIIDLSATGAQPMLSADGKLAVTFNGEIYNFQQLRRSLEAKGCAFRSRSDTEVLLQLYADQGEAMVHELRGMFAFAIWDAERRSLFLARDPYGIKPLYFADNGHTIRFASQVKALLAGGAMSDELCLDAQVGFHLFGSVPEPLTIARDVRALPAGHTMVIGTEGPTASRRYHAIASVYAEVEQRAVRPLIGPERRAAAREAFLDSVRHHLVADVPVGAFLSAGIDSSALVGLMRDAGQSAIETVTLSFREFEGSASDEAPIAAEVARTYGTQHTTRIVTKVEFDEDLPRILAAMDQPSIDGINCWFVAKAAHERGLKVAISGVGGDELLGGYPAFREIPRWVGWLRLPAAVPGLGLLLRNVVGAIGLGRLGLSPKIAGMVEYGGSFAGAWLLRRGLYMPWEIAGILGPDAAQVALERFSPTAITHGVLQPMPRGDFARVATLEAALYMRNQLLRDTDWASMAHSIEVRTPLVDHVLLDRMAAIGPPEPIAPAKSDLARAPTTPLPPAVLDRPKTGFAIPVGRWLSPDASPASAARPHGYARDWARRLSSGLSAPPGIVAPAL